MAGFAHGVGFFTRFRLSSGVGGAMRKFLILSIVTLCLHNI